MTEVTTSPGGTFIETGPPQADSLALAQPPTPGGLPAARGTDGNGPGGTTPVSLGPRAPLPPPPSPGVPTHRSSYMEFLPGIYEDSDFLGRYLLIVESVLSPIVRTVDNIPYLFDPGVTPADLLPWLASWVSVVLDGRWPEERRRDIVAAAPSLFRWRGTARGMREFVRLATGFEPEIVEPTLSDIAANRGRAFRFVVRLRVPRAAGIDRDAVQVIIDMEKPAFTAGNVEIVFVD